VEVKVVQQLNKKFDPSDGKSIVRLLDSFECKGHILSLPKSVPINIDRLSGASQLYNAARGLYEDIPEVASNSIDTLSYTQEVLRDHVNKNVFLYLLQDVRVPPS
jgi:hypothetical protein